MNINPRQLETALESVQNALKNQDLPGYMKKRWSRALEKAKDRLIEQPYFSWQPDRLLIVSVPKEKSDESGCRFYEANERRAAALISRGCVRHFLKAFRAGIAPPFCF